MVSRSECMGLESPSKVLGKELYNSNRVAAISNGKTFSYRNTEYLFIHDLS